MTFASDEVRLSYHQLPAATQVEYSDWEARLAEHGQSIHVEAIAHDSNILEIILRIRTKPYAVPAGPCAS